MTNDLVTVARELQARRIASPKNLFIKGARHHGWIALQAALSRPELFRGVVLQDPLLDLAGVVHANTSPVHAAFVALWGTDTETLRALSPLEQTPEFFPLDILISLSDKRPASGFLGTLEWIRRTTCEHPELRSLLVSLENTQPQSSADAALLPHEERFIRSTLLLEW
jgi:pimeloyl-ACP methyl ester carboxylesterase